MKFRVLLSLMILCSSVGPARAEEDEARPLAPWLERLGDYSYPVTTDSEAAQHFFDQALTLLYGFNHLEATRSFKEAARRDPDCAMAYFGQALALGPNINDSGSAERDRQAWQALQEGLALGKKASAKERDFMEALSARYSDQEDPDRDAHARAFREAMKKLYARYPDDPEVGTIYAASIMNTMPWNYWERDGSPRPGTEETIETLEKVIARYPRHPGAHHYYIHIVEASDNPDRGVPSADVLGDLAPSAGHLVHMPSHIYIRVGRYHDASEANRKAILADEDYITQCAAQGIYPVGYYPHNIHFLWAAATLEGRSAQAISSARKLYDKSTPEDVPEAKWIQDYLATPYYALVRFGRWEEILREEEPKAPFLQAMWHYARALAYTAYGRLEKAEGEARALEGFIEHDDLKEFPVGSRYNLAPRILEIAHGIVTGEMAARRRDYEAAVERVSRAVQLQDSLAYTEPPSFHYPVRQTLGAILVEAGRYAEAEEVYREDLEENRETGWSLFGLLQALRAQGKEREAADVEMRFQRAWARADVILTSSRF